MGDLLLSASTRLSGSSKISLEDNQPYDCLRFKVYSEGNFLLRSPKRMTGTEGFLEQANSQGTDCQREREETCQIREFAEKGFENCACRPWGLLSALPDEVLSFSSNNHHDHSLF